MFTNIIDDEYKRIDLFKSNYFSSILFNVNLGGCFSSSSFAISISNWVHNNYKYKGTSQRGVVAIVLICNIVVSEFELQLGHHIHFLSNTLEKGMKHLVSPAIR